MNTRCKTTYNHAYTLAFSLNSARKDGYVTGRELRQALQARLDDLGDGELIEACGAPDETLENDAVKPSCAERAAWAERAVRAYAKAREGLTYDPVIDMASDLITDLCHLLVKEGVLPDLALERARNHCQDERAEEGIVI
jgi:hypothetical protein